MQIQFQRSGGFAGMLLDMSLDTETLPPEAAQEVESAIQQANFFQLPADLTSPQIGADRFQYRLTVTDKDQEHTVQVGEAAAPEQLLGLLQQLTNLARTMRS